MNPALLYLLRKTTRGALRQARRRLTGGKGLLKTLAVVAVLLLIVGPSIGRLFIPRDAEGVANTVALLRAWGPPGLFLFVFLAGLSARSLYFKPAEVDFLFPAPISRRQLVVYNLLARLRVVVLSALWCCLFLCHHAPRWFAGATGILLALIFLQTTSQCMGLFFSALSEALGKTLRRLGFVALACLVGGGLLLVRSQVPADGGVLEAARELAESSPVRVLSSVTRPFVEVFLAESILSYLLWTSIALGILALEVFLMTAFDVAYTERAVAASRRLERALRRMRSGGGLPPGEGRRIWFSLPHLPRLGGAGALAWRQLTEMTRNLRSIVVMSLLMFVPVLPVVLMTSEPEKPAGVSEEGVTGFGIDPSTLPPLIMVFFFSFIFSQNVFFDFRRDLDRMDLLKSLPLAGSALAAGQLLATVLILTSVQAAVVSVLVLGGGRIGLEVLVGVLFLLPPLNWVVAGVDNALFLLFPYRMAAESGVGNPFFGRVMMVMLVKMLAVALLGLLAFLGGLAAWYVTGGSYVLAFAAAVALLLGACVPATWFVARSFASFDITRDRPA